MFEKSLAIRRKVFGDDHPQAAHGYNNLAANLQAQGKFVEAQALWEKALTIYRDALGEEHPTTALIYNNLAVNLLYQDRPVEGQPLCEKCLAIRRKVSEDHPDTALSYNNLGSNLVAQDKYAEAQPHFEKALAISRKVLGEDHPTTALCYNNVAFNLFEQGRYTQAQPLFEKALAIRQKALGDTHPTTAEAYNNLADNLNAQGKYDKALEVLERAAQCYECSRLTSAGGLDRSVATGNVSPYPLTAMLLARLRRSEQAWYALEHHLARGLLDQLAERQVRGLQPDEQRKQEELTRQLSELRPRLLYLLTQQERSDIEDQELANLTMERRRLETELANLGALRSKARTGRSHCRSPGTTRRRGPCRLGGT